MGAPGFWDDQQQAAQISTEHSRVTKRLERYRRLDQEYDDARELPRWTATWRTRSRSARAAAGRARPAARRTRSSTASTTRGDAVVTIHAGAGGTDSQDWAEILLRMYLRWAERRGFQTELIEASPGEEAGLKSATFTVARRERLRRSSRPSAACTGSSGSPRSTRRTAGTPRSRR